MIRLAWMLALVAAGYAIAEAVDTARGAPLTGAIHHHVDRQPSLRSQS